MRGQTLQQISQRVVKLLGQVYGTNVQTYSEPRIKEMIQARFELLFDEYWWPQFWFTSQYTLDGTTGKVTADLSSVLKRFEDISAVFREKIATPLPRINRDVNTNLVVGTFPKFIEPVNDSTKLFRIVPYTATGNIVVHGRTLPDRFGDSTAINFDDWALIYGTVYDFIVDDGTNERQEQKYQRLFMKRLEQLIQLDNVQRIPTNYREAVIPTSDGWWTNA